LSLAVGRKERGCEAFHTPWRAAGRDRRFPRRPLTLTRFVQPRHWCLGTNPDRPATGILDRTGAGKREKIDLRSFFFISAFRHVPALAHARTPPCPHCTRRRCRHA
jgi:hypothetical protein